MISPVSDYYSLGLIMAILAGSFGVLTAVICSEFPVMKYFSIGCGVIFFIGLGICLHYGPLYQEEYNQQQRIESLNESNLKTMDCKSIQKYLLDSLPSDNTTTKFAIH